MGINGYVFSILLASRVLAGELVPTTTDLYGAAIQGHLQTVKSIVEMGVTPNAIGYGGTPVLSAAARAGHLEVVRFLVEKGANPNIRSLSSQGTPAMAACSGGNLEVVKYLKETAKADFSLEDRLGSTALQFAARGGFFDVVKYLTAHGVNAAHQDWLGRTPLADAKHYYKDEIAWYLNRLNAPLFYPLEESDWVLFDLPKYHLRMRTPGSARSSSFDHSVRGTSWRVTTYQADHRGLFSVVAVWQATSRVPKDMEYSEQDLSLFNVALVRHVALKQALNQAPHFVSSNPVVYDGFKGFESLYTVSADADVSHGRTTPLQFKILSLGVKARVFQMALIYNKERETSRDIRRYFSQIKVDLSRE